MLKTPLSVAILCVAWLLMGASCDNKGSRANVAPPLPAPLPPYGGPGGGSGVSNFPFFFGGYFQIVDRSAYYNLLKSVSPFEFCEDDGWYNPVHCNNVINVTQSAYIGRDNQGDGLLFVGLSSLSGAPLGEFGLGLVKTDIRTGQWLSLGRTTYTNGGGYRPGISYRQTVGSDVYGGQFNLFNNNSSRVLSTTGVNTTHFGRRYELFIQTMDLTRNNLQVELRVAGQIAATATLVRNFDYAGNSFYFP